MQLCIKYKIVSSEKIRIFVVLTNLPSQNIPGVSRHCNAIIVSKNANIKMMRKIRRKRTPLTHVQVIKRPIGDPTGVSGNNIEWKSCMYIRSRYSVFTVNVL